MEETLNRGDAGGVGESSNRVGDLVENVLASSRHDGKVPIRKRHVVLAITADLSCERGDAQLIVQAHLGCITLLKRHTHRKREKTPPLTQSDPELEVGRKHVEASRCQEYALSINGAEACVCL